MKGRKEMIVSGKVGSTLLRSLFSPNCVPLSYLLSTGLLSDSALSRAPTGLHARLILTREGLLPSPSPDSYSRPFASSRPPASR